MDPRRLLAPSAVMPACHLPQLCRQRSWPGLALVGGGALTGKGRAREDDDVRQMKSAGRGGGEAREGGGMWF